jgi:hypothetical protein
VDDSEYLKQRDQINRELSLMPNPIQEIEAYREPADHLRSIGVKMKRLLATGKPEALSLFQEFCETAFTEIVVSGSRVLEVKPADRYREMMAIGLQERVWYGAVKRTRPLTSSTWALETSAGAIFFIGIDSIVEIVRAA